MDKAFCDLRASAVVQGRNFFQITVSRVKKIHLLERTTKTKLDNIFGCPNRRKILLKLTWDFKKKFFVKVMVIT